MERFQNRDCLQSEVAGNCFPTTILSFMTNNNILFYPFAAVSALLCFIRIASIDTFCFGRGTGSSLWFCFLLRFPEAPRLRDRAVHQNVGEEHFPKDGLDGAVERAALAVVCGLDEIDAVVREEGRIFPSFSSR